MDDPPYARLLSGIRGLRLHVFDVVAKFEAVVAFYERLGYIDGGVLVLGRRLDRDVP